MKLRLFGLGLWLVAAAIAAMTSCSGASDPTGESASATVQAAADAGHVTITNTSDTEIVYGVRDARVQFVQPQCWAPAVCPRLAPGATTEVPFDEIVGYDAASTTEVIIAIWQYVIGGDGPELRGGREIHVKL